MKRASNSERAKVGARLKHFRDQAGLKVEAIARLADIDRTHHYALERGDCWPSLDLLHTYAGILGEDMADFFVFPDDHPRHRFRELARLLKPSELTLVIEAAERVLGRSLDQIIESAHVQPQPSARRKTR